MSPHRSINFLRSKQVFRSRLWRRAGFWRRLFRNAAAVAVAAAAVGTAVVWIAGVRVLNNVEAGKQAVALAQTEVQSLRLDAAAGHLEEAETAFGAAKRSLDRFGFLGGVPYAGGRISAADRLLAGGAAATSAARDVLVVMRDIVAVAAETEALSGALLGAAPAPSTIFKDLGVEKKRQMLATLAESAPRLRAAAERAGEALASLDQVAADPEAGEFLSSSVAPIRGKLRQFQTAVAALAPVSEMLPWLLGYPDERHYLIFLQNNTELRPTGGFLGTYGLVSIKDAELAGLETHDVYGLDGPSEATARPRPPEPIAKYIGIDKWYLRDANWSPDFGSSARIMEQFFNDEYAVANAGVRPPRIDAIVGLTPELVVDLMRIVGPITVDGQKFEAENLVDELEYQVEQGFLAAGIPLGQRKEIVGKLAAEVVRRLSALPLSELTRVVAAIDENLDESQILMAVKDERIQRFVEAHDWGGKMKPVAGDYVSVIDANLAALKTDSVIERSVTHTLKPDGQGGFIASVSATYRNRGGFTWKTTRYRTYMRAYVPKGSVLISSSGAMENDKIKDPARRPGKVDVSEELGRTVFGAFIAVEPGETRTLQYVYKLPAAVAEEIAIGAYRLDVEKQPGTISPRLTLDLDFGKKIRWAEPGEDPKNFGDSKFGLVSDLRLDRHFEVRF